MERSYFFDSTDEQQRTYQAADFARFHEQIIGNGVSNTKDLADLSVEPKMNMTVILGAGYMFANGYMYENTAAMDLTHDLAEPTMDRIDRVIVRFDNNPETRKTYAYIKKGIPGADPIPPDLTRDGYSYEMSVAQVRILAGKSFIEASEITDERPNDTVCGYIPLHNIYRGLGIDQLGIVTMPNQSFVNTSKNDISFYVNKDAQTIVPLGVPDIDRQGEIVGDEFIPKSRGTYLIWHMFRAALISDNVGQDLQLHLFRNDNMYEFPFVARTATNTSENIYVGTQVEFLEAGDRVKIGARLYNGTAEMQVIDTWTRISKLN